MTLALTRHPDTPCEAIKQVEVSLHRESRSRLVLTYYLVGDMNRLRLPDFVGPRRADDLWRTTCFELFLRDGSGGYAEFNFSPSGEWAAYAFDSYRSGMASIAGEPVLANGNRVETGSMGLIATVDLGTSPHPSGTGAVSVGLSAVIEETSGAKSYWALAHPPGKPDFHHPDTFASTLEPA